MRNFVDFHCHLLPSMDDGAIDGRDSLEMALALAEFGFATVHCTPHRIAGSFENPPERVRLATESMQRMLDGAGIALKLVPGTEHYLDEFLPEMVPGALTAGASRYLLVEVPFRSGADLVPGLVSGLASHGFSPLFAHPERCRSFQPVRDAGLRGALSYVLGKRKEPDLEGSLLATLKQTGCRFQGNLGSFAGAYGSEVQQLAVFFLKQGVYSCLGSDAHTPRGLAALLAGGWEVVVDTIGETAASRLLEGEV